MQQDSAKWKYWLLLFAREIFGYLPKDPPLELSMDLITPLDVTRWYNQDKNEGIIDQFWVLFRYQDISTVLKDWKYHANTEAKDAIDSLYKQALLELPEFSSESKIMYMPIGFDRWMERRFNQSEHLARQVSTTLGLDVFSPIFRFWSGIHQARLTQQKRQLRQISFWIPPFVKVPKHVILIDDVVSTGSTIIAGARYLKSHGVEHITVIALARSQSDSGKF